MVNGKGRILTSDGKDSTSLEIEIDDPATGRVGSAAEE
jgi:hypothetical protein